MVEAAFLFFSLLIMKVLWMLWKNFAPLQKKYDVTLAQLAIRWVIQQKGITAPIVGAKNPSQVLDNVKACNFVISDEDFKAIDKISQAFAYELPHFQTFFRA